MNADQSESNAEVEVSKNLERQLTSALAREMEFRDFLALVMHNLGNNMAQGELHQRYRALLAALTTSTP